MLIHERGIISDAEYSDTNKYSKQEQASGTDCLFTSVGLGRTKLPYQMTHMQMTPEAPTQPTELLNMMASWLLCPDPNALPFIATTYAELCKFQGALLCSCTLSKGY